MYRCGRRSIALIGLAACVSLLAAACDSIGPKPVPGTVTVSLAPANPSDGAVLLMLAEKGIGAIHEIPGRVMARHVSGSWFVAVVSPSGGELSFEIDLDDTSTQPTAQIREVADVNNTLRRSVAAYTVRFRR